VIPDANIPALIEDPLPECDMPRSEEITEEGFGGFRDTHLIGRVLLSDAKAVVDQEATVLEELDRVAHSPEEFEALARAVEDGDRGSLGDGLRDRFMESTLVDLAAPEDDFDQLGSLEVGVAGLVQALSAMRCLTAASCRSHVDPLSWSDCPVVFFAAPTWRVEVLAGLVRTTGCGLAADRGLIKIYGSSIRQTHALARLILDERVRFRRRPGRSPGPRADGDQLSLIDDASNGA
jgi:hypothetical protein